MTNNVISAGEAWAEVERLQISVNWNEVKEQWCATYKSAHQTPWGGYWILGWGSTPLEAVADVRARIGEVATAKAEAVSA